MKSSKDTTDRAGLRIHQTVARTLGMAILAGEYPPGSRIGNEMEQSETLGVSRTAYREAMRILIAKGLLESRPRAGTHVTAQDRWTLFDPQVLEWMFSSRPDRNLVRDIFELRGILEPEAARLAARRCTEAQLEIMGSALADMQALSLATAEGQAADQNFHRTLLAAADNRALESLAGSIGAAVHWTTHFKQRLSASPRDAIPDHQAVLAAIADRDEQGAVDAMRMLVDLAFQDMSAALD